MSYILYGTRRSGSLPVELALAEIGADYRVVDVDLETDAQRDADYAAINPQRKLPTLITPAGETLTESAAILITLDERHREASLLPPPASPERAQALRWLLFIAAEIYPLVEINDYPERFAPAPDGAPQIREAARSKWRERWLVLERHLAGNPYSLEQGFCLLDLYIAVVSRWAQQDDWRAGHLPKVERITAEVGAREACATVWQRHRPGDLPLRLA